MAHPNPFWKFYVCAAAPNSSLNSQFPSCQPTHIIIYGHDLYGTPCGEERKILNRQRPIHTERPVKGMGRDTFKETAKWNHSPMVV